VNVCAKATLFAAPQGIEVHFDGVAVPSSTPVFRNVTSGSSPSETLRSSRSTCFMRSPSGPRWPSLRLPAVHAWSCNLRCFCAAGSTPRWPKRREARPLRWNAKRRPWFGRKSDTGTGTGLAGIAYEHPEAMGAKAVSQALRGEAAAHVPRRLAVTSSGGWPGVSGNLAEDQPSHVSTAVVGHWPIFPSPRQRCRDGLRAPIAVKA